MSTMGLWLTTNQLKNRSAKWGLEDNTTWYSQEKKKLWIKSVFVSVCLPVTVCLSHHGSFNLFQE